MENVITIHEALISFRESITSVKKWAKNPFFHSNYADLPSILEVIKEPLHTAWLSLYHKVVNNNWYVLITTISTKDWQTIESEFPIFWTKPQEIWSSITYARRYNIQALLDIPTEDDDANASNNSKQIEKKEVKWYNDVAKNLPSWKESVKEWKITVDEILKKIEYNWFSLNKWNKDLILSLKN